jgi:hypothetical protein
MNFLSARFATIKDFLATQHWPTGAQLKNLGDWNYYTQNPVPAESPFLLLAAVIILLTVAGLLIWWWQARQKEKTTPVYGLLLDQLPTLVIFVVAGSIFYAFCWAQSVQYLSSRLFLLAAGLVTLGWVIYLAVYARRVLPGQLQKHLERERFFRYLPKKKQ